MIKERELRKVTREKDREAKQLKMLEKKKTEPRKQSGNCCKANENLIYSIYDNLVIVTDICSENIEAFKNGICSFGYKYNKFIEKKKNLIIYQS